MEFGRNFAKKGSGQMIGSLVFIICRFVLRNMHWNTHCFHLLWCNISWLLKPKLCTEWLCSVIPMRPWR